MTRTQTTLIGLTDNTCAQSSWNFPVIQSHASISTRRFCIEVCFVKCIWQTWNASLFQDEQLRKEVFRYYGTFSRSLVKDTGAEGIYRIANTFHQGNGCHATSRFLWTDGYRCWTQVKLMFLEASRQNGSVQQIMNFLHRPEGIHCHSCPTVKSWFGLIVRVLPFFPPFRTLPCQHLRNISVNVWSSLADVCRCEAFLVHIAIDVWALGILKRRGPTRAAENDPKQLLFVYWGQDAMSWILY